MILEREEFSKKLGLEIKVRRIRVGLSQDDLSKKIGVDRRTVSLWERGAVVPNAFFILVLVREIGEGVLDVFKKPEIQS